MVAFWWLTLSVWPTDVQRGLAEAPEVRLYSLYPYQMTDCDLDGKPLPKGPKLYDNLILGSTLLTGPERKELLDALRWSAFARVPLGSAGCFSPRHSLSFQWEGRHYDVKVCFQCGKSEVYRDGERTIGWVEHTGYGADQFIAILRRHHVPLSRD